MAQEGPDHTGLSPSSPCQALPQDFPAPWGIHMSLGVPQQQEHKAGSAQGLKNQPGGAREEQGHGG